MIDPIVAEDLIDRALAEDIGFCDLTSELVIPAEARAELALNARQDIVVAGTNREYFWLTGRMNIVDTAQNTDVVAVRERYISITPIHYELTDRAMMEEMQSWDIALLR